MAGVRSSKTVGSTTYKYDTLSGKVMRQSWGSNVIDFVYDENNQPYAMRYRSTTNGVYNTYYYVLNVQGDVVGLLNSSGAIAAKYTYDPWGKVTVQNPSGTTNISSSFIGNINPLRYRGYYYDTETGFYYLQSRYYDPAIGRFINADTYTTTDADGLLSTNMFAYCENNPVMGTDPTGEWVHIVIGALVNAGVEVLTQLATGTKLRNINWVDVAAQGVVGAVSSATIPLKAASKAVKAAINITKNVGVSILAESVSQSNSNSKKAGKTAAIGTQATIDTLIDKGVGYLLRGTKAKAAKAVVRTVQQSFSFTFGLTIETLFSRSNSRHVVGR